MVIVFLDPNTDSLYICSENEKMKKIDLGNANLLSFIPDDDLLYVQDGIFLTKHQFQDWLEGGAQFAVPAPQQTPMIPASIPASQPVQTRQASSQSRPYDPNRLYLKPAHNGSVLIPDINTEKYPDGLKMNGKWDFVPIDDIGGIDVVNSNRFIRNQLEKKRIQIVDEAFVRKHQDKAHPYVSPAQRSIDSILIDEPAKKAVKSFFDQDDEETEGEYGPVINVRGD
jgi:hypothetical protein